MPSSVTPQTELSPAPIAVPETATPEAGSAVPAPAEDNAPADSALGDRYSTGNDLPDASTTTTPSEPPVVVPTETPVQEIPAQETNAQDVFDEPTPVDEEAAPSEPVIPIPTDEEAKPEDSEPKRKTTVDEDFFKSFGAKGSEQTEKNESEEAAEEEAEEEDDAGDTQQPIKQPGEYVDPFGGKDTFSKNDQSSVLTIAGGLQSELDRTWTDDTSSFACQARLIRVTAKQVILQKPTGAKSAVPLARLGQDDLQFVHQQVVALRIAHEQVASAEKLAAVWD